MSPIACTSASVKEIPLAALPILFYRLWLAVVLFGVLLVFRRRPISLAALWRSVPAGIFLALDMAMFFSALKLTSVAVATVIGALRAAHTSPVTHSRRAHCWPSPATGSSLSRSPAPRPTSPTGSSRSR